MAGFKTFIIGSEQGCDIHLERSSISPRHAELVIARNGKLHLTDCNTETGTFRKRSDRWVHLNQDYVQPAEPIRFGDYHTSISALLNIVAPDGVAALLGGEKGDAGGGIAFDSKAALPTGRVRRSIETGEILPLKDDK